MSDMTTIRTCDKCGLYYRDSLRPHECADWTKGRKDDEDESAPPARELLVELDGDDNG